MTIFVEPIPEPNQVPELKQLLDHKHDDEFVNLLEKSLKAAHDKASQDLNPALFKAIPFGTGHWPTTFDDYAKFLVKLVPPVGQFV